MCRYDAINWRWYYLFTYVTHEIAAVELNGKWGLIDTECKTIVKPQYDKIEVMSDKLIRAEIGEEVKLLNYDGTEIWCGNRKNILILGRRTEKFFEVIENGKHGLINLEGEVVIPAIYNNIWVNRDNNMFETSYKDEETGIWYYQTYNWYGRKIGGFRTKRN